MGLPLPVPVMVLLYSGVWLTLHFVCGYVAHRLPGRLFERGSVFDRVLRAGEWEAGGRVYRHLGIRRWKGFLPEAGGLFKGGFDKRHLGSSEAAYLEQFRRETNRAEFSHWLTLVSASTFFIWNPWWVGLAMIGYAILTNLPFIVIQRYNRPRLEGLPRRSPDLRRTKQGERPLYHFVQRIAEDLAHVRLGFRVIRNTAGTIDGAGAGVVGCKSERHVAVVSIEHVLQIPDAAVDVFGWVHRVLDAE